MNIDELRNIVKGLDHDQVLSLMNMIEHEHPVKITAITRRDIECVLANNDEWRMTDEQWEQFTATYFWRKGIDENVDYGFLWGWVRDEWSDLGNESPEGEVLA